MTPMARQRTIKGPVEVKGIGLQTGQTVVLRLKAAPPNSGINFVRTDLSDNHVLNIRAIDFTAGPAKERRTTLGLGPFEIQTTEHFLSALSGLSIDNITAELDGAELPGMDGSARDFTDALKRAGAIEQDADKKLLKIDKPIWVGEGEGLLAIFPDDDFRVSYTLSYKGGHIGTQFFSAVISESNYETEIAPARTFCLEEEALELLRRGLGKGANYENTLVMGKDGPLKNRLRFADEPVRHKVLDLIGDLYLAGAAIKGHVLAVKSGHKLNMEMVKKLKEETSDGK